MGAGGSRGSCENPSSQAHVEVSPFFSLIRTSLQPFGIRGDGWDLILMPVLGWTPLESAHLLPLPLMPHLAKSTAHCWASLGSPMLQSLSE